MHKGKDKKGRDNLHGEVCTTELPLSNSTQTLRSLDTAQPLELGFFLSLVGFSGGLFGVFFFFSMSL